MKRKMMVPVFVGLWLMILGIITYVNSEIYELCVEGMISSEIAALLNEKVSYSALGMATVISIGLYFWLRYTIKQIKKPLAELTQEAKQFGKGKHTHTLRQYEMEEMNALATAFDKMGERFYRAIRKLEYQKSKAESVLDHLEDGILILDEEGYIIEQNEFVKRYLNVPETLKKCHIKNILREITCQNMLMNALEKRIASSCEVVKNDKIFHVRIGLIGKGESQYGYIVTLTDITKTRQLEAIRYQFVTNVTHELKTPLTSIQGFVETLQNGAIENKEIAKRFLDIIDIETKRLYRLIQEILLLSEIENMEGVCNEEVVLQETIDEVIALLEKEAVEKDIVLKLEVDTPIILQKTSYDHVKQVVMNLMSNAIKYTDQGEVCVKLYEEGNKYIFSVSDTGIGIAEKHIDQIFERFYRVDKSRSRKSGGTGLGLSIVKHIVQFYQWEIKVESEKNKGSTFKIIF